jgi:hypothetical protein
VCPTLQLIRAATAVQVSSKRTRELLALFPSSCQDLKQPLQDWSSVIPCGHGSPFAHVWRPKGSSEAPQAPCSEQARMNSAAELAVASNLLSHPLTLLHCLGAGPGPGSEASAAATAASSKARAKSAGAIKRALEQVQRRNRGQPAGSPPSPLVVCVLGASGTAELAQPSVWRMLEGCCPSGVSLQFVGPEVPQDLHRTVAQPSPGVEMAFWRVSVAAVDLLGCAWEWMKMEAPGPEAALQTACFCHEQGKYDALMGLVLEPGDSSKKEGKQPRPPPAALRQIPDVIVGFNMGVTCTDYSWKRTLKTMQT